MFDIYREIPGNNAETSVGKRNLLEENVIGFFTNSTLLSIVLLSLLKSKPFPKTTSKFKKEYDYVIVGAGTAGSVIASRLSEIPCVNVLLLEAGGEASTLTEIPAAARLFYESEIDWTYKTEPQKHCAKAHKEQRVVWNSGKVLGGSSVLNAMLYARGNKKNYDKWAEEGAKGWSFKEVLPYFTKLEDHRAMNEVDEGYHATGGPMTIEKPKYTPKFKKPVMESLESLGYEETDPNGKIQTGIYDLQGTLRDGQRCSAAKAYLVPAEKRPNLHIVKNAFARKILIENGTAYGVEFDFGGRTHEVRARREVIISSGSVRTPQILMLSGIGPAKELEKFNIDVVADLPVGENLQDHYSTYMPFLLTSETGSLLLRYFNPINLWKYFISRSGPLASPNQCSVLAFLDGLNRTSTSRDFPKQELYFVDYDTVDAKYNYNLKPEVYKEVFGPYEGKPMYACLVSLLQPKSRGTIKLKSTNPYDHPIIDPRYFEDEEDMKDIVEGMKICHAVANSKEMKQVGSKPLDTVFPGCEQFVGNYDKLFRCHAESLVLTVWHPVGTARMGSRDDPRSVVDPELRVIGVEGLRVINAAVMPIIPSANTNVPTMMIAERAFDIMRRDIVCGNYYSSSRKRFFFNF